MSSAEVITLADGVVDDLNAATLVPEVTAERRYLPYAPSDASDLKSLASLKCIVVPKTDAPIRDNRSEFRNELVVDIGLQQKLLTIDNDKIDPLVTIVQAVADYYRFQRQPIADAVLQNVETVLWDPGLLREFKVYTGVVTLTFRKYRT